MRRVGRGDSKTCDEWGEGTLKHVMSGEEGL